MPTPDDSHQQSTTSRSHSSSCPEIDAILDAINEITAFRTSATQQIGAERDGSTDEGDASDSSTTPTKLRHEIEDPSREAFEGFIEPRSSSTEPEGKQQDVYAYSLPLNLGYALTGESALTFSDLSALRRRPIYPSSFLRPGSKFVGTQKDKQIYDVEVEIQHVDMQQSTICGYLKIDGLTPDYPSLVTFFDGEIVGPHYSFITKHADWGATERSDIAHWDRFPAFRPLAKQAKNPDFHPKNISQKENIFMRWKERFLVPDYKVSDIAGASYEGFYYICFNQIHGTISGIYFHAKSDRYQQLELKHVNDFGRLAHIEWA